MGRVGGPTTVVEFLPAGVAQEQIPAITPHSDRTTANPEYRNGSISTERGTETWKRFRVFTNEGTAASRGPTLTREPTTTGETPSNSWNQPFFWDFSPGKSRRYIRPCLRIETRSHKPRTAVTKKPTSPTTGTPCHNGGIRAWMINAFAIIRDANTIEKAMRLVI